MSGSNCCFLTRIQVSQEAGKVVWYSQLLKNFIVIHTVKGFSIVKWSRNVFLELSWFFYDPTDVGNLISGSSPFSESSLNICNFRVHVLLKPGLENLEHYFTSVWDECSGAVLLVSSLEITLDCSVRATSQLRIKTFHEVKVLVTQSCLTCYDPWTVCSPPGFSVHGILQARILEWVAIPPSRGYSQLGDWTWVSCIVGRFFTIWATQNLARLNW